ncbi:hypothetical protein SSX86_020381 [Deinandra increscens subsp. villosa]|uniref:Uncharacterized protein n=1 Tax=Deinandra increscens subsp. villosa TaxID=3103831 RepID=A0AAP0CT06_9ASTR
MKKCSDCGQTGHTSSECKNGKVGSFHLFGVKIDPLADQLSEEDESLQIVNGVDESKSTENLKRQDNEHSSSIDHGQDKKKGMPWTEDEHRSFLKGLEKLGKGSWRAISKDYVPSRTPTQVASHAQKYFIRMNATDGKRNQRSSLFDVPCNEFSAESRASVLRPAVAPLALTYGIEGYNQFPNVTGYRKNHIPLMSSAFVENVCPLNRWMEPVAALASQRVPINNEETSSSKYQSEPLAAALESQRAPISNRETSSSQYELKPLADVESQRVARSNEEISSSEEPEVERTKD